MKHYIHDYGRQMRVAKRAIEKSTLSKRDKELIAEFEKHIVLKGLSVPRIVKYLGTLKRIGLMLGKDFEKATESDIKDIISRIIARNYSEWTKRSYKIITRIFYKWLRGTKDYPDEVKWINAYFRKDLRKLPSEGELLTEDEIKKLISAANNPRDQALISILYESGCRIGELGSAQLKHIAFDKHGVLLNVSGKTGSRKIRLINSTAYLARWMDVHPRKNNKEAFLFVNLNQNRGEPIAYAMVRKILKKIFLKAGVNKRCNPHIFRHSRATFLANHLTEFQMNQYLGWVQGSDMPSTYVHLSGKSIDGALLKLNGIETKEKKTESTLKPRICSRCKTINNYDTMYCSKCGLVLDPAQAQMLEDIEKKEEVVAESDDIMNKLFSDPDVLGVIRQKLQILNQKVI